MRALGENRICSTFRLLYIALTDPHSSSFICVPMMMMVMTIGHSTAAEVKGCVDERYDSVTFLGEFCV